VVRGLIRLRYQLIPYLYSLAQRHHATFEPIARPTFHDFPGDPACLADTDDYLVGPDLLVATVVEPGATSREVYLPAGARWADFWTGEWFDGGRTVRVAAPWGRPPLFVREGAAIPLNIGAQSFGQRADARAFAIFAPQDGTFRAMSYEDDGETEAWRRGGAGGWSLEVAATPDRLAVQAAAEGPNAPSGPLTLLVRASETRPLVGRDGRELATHLDGGWRRADLDAQ
jgi:alpha-glucosidase